MTMLPHPAAASFGGDLLFTEILADSGAAELGAGVRTALKDPFLGLELDSGPIAPGRPHPGPPAKVEPFRPTLGVVCDHVELGAQESLGGILSTRRLLLGRAATAT